LHEALKEQGVVCSKNRVARRLRFLNLKAKAKAKFRITTTDSKHNLPTAPNVLNRDFTATEPNQKWAGDITYIPTNEGWVYLAVVLDLYSRAVVGWSIQSTMTRKLVCGALQMALNNRKNPTKVLFHSDRGSQYCSDDFQMILKERAFISSMSRKGNCWDNAVVESFFHTLKVELTHSMQYSTREYAKQSIFEYIEVYYNRKRMHSSVKYMAPLTFESQFEKVA
jgi:transposase InsO family protein